MKKLVKKFFIFLLACGLVAAVVISVSGVYFSHNIEKRFAGRMWSIPSRVYSDTTLIFTGMEINRALFELKLSRLKYRMVHEAPYETGTYRKSGDFFDICLNPLDMPGKRRDGYPVRIRLDKGKIISMKRMDTDAPLFLLELEPEELMSFFGKKREQRSIVSIDEVPRDLVNAVMAAEDNRFYSHLGIDPRGILRAFYVNIVNGRIRQGGSTLTQQLAKNYFLTPERTIIRKLKEMLIAVLLELKYEKDQILEIYLNEIYLGQEGSVSVNGAGEAARFYFSKPVTELSTSECAVIAGLIRGPNIYSPYKNKRLCLKRRNQVLHSMHKNGWLTDEELEKALNVPVTTSGDVRSVRTAPYFMDYLSSQLTELYSPEALSSLGLSIYTTLDTQVQAAAENALEKGLSELEYKIPALKRKEPEKSLQGAVIVLQPRTGNILAMVGGKDYNLSQFNRITQARRQPGSLFKPIAYVSALDFYTPATIFENEGVSCLVDGRVWEPGNFSHMNQKKLSMRDALSYSANIATVDLAMKTGLENIVRTAGEFGFTTPFKPYPSLALGAFEVIPLELARAYCAFAADGVSAWPLSLRKVVDENGEPLEQRHMEIKNIISPGKAFLMNSMLESVARKGTAGRLSRYGIDFPVAAKTGTSSDYRDAWFVGYTPDFLALVWIGFDNGDSVYTTGGAAALPVWAYLVNALPQYVSEAEFRKPPGIVTETVCAESGERFVSGYCKKPVEEFFLKENCPDEPCRLHEPSGTMDKLLWRMKSLVH